MKNFKLISFLIIIASPLLFVQCTTDPIPGPAGMNGTDGVDGTNGINGTTECAVCHNIAVSESVHASYLYSGHAAGGAVSYAGSRASCAQCHSSNGYVDYALTGSTTDYDNPQPIGCVACHGEHSTFAFETEGYDFALRMFGPVELIADPSYVINFENTSNNCAFCHQPRRSPPTDNGLGQYEVTSTHWGPHHGPQATFLEGIQGAEIAGSVAYLPPQSAAHRKGADCVSCHMGETSANATDGNHTFIPTPTSCVTCHTNGIPEAVTGLNAQLEVLESQLQSIGIIDAEGHPVPGTYPIAQAEAAWNYLLIVKEDKSDGLHNPAYAKALVTNSVEALNAN